MKRYRLVSLVIVVVSLLAVGGWRIYAATGTSFSFDPITQNYSASFTPSTNDDGAGNDWVCVVCYNAAGEAIDVDTASAAVGGGAGIFSRPICDPILGAGPATSAAMGDATTDRPVPGDNSPLVVDWCIASTGGGVVDTDGDGVPDTSDICPGFDDQVDTDNDGIPDGCDTGLVDTDRDGVPDTSDICPGFNDQVDTDNDGIPDGCDSSGSPSQVPVALPPPGCDARLNLPEGSVVGLFTSDIVAYWRPNFNSQTYPEVLITAGKTLWVLGQDSTHQFYQVLLQCRLLWVPIPVMAPNPDRVWNSTPLPITVIETSDVSD